MSEVFFKPYIGKHYLDKGYLGKKLLILGESHYCGGCDKCGDLQNFDDGCREFTKTVVNDYLSYKKGEINHANWMRTFTVFTNVLLGKQVEPETVIDFWDSIMFYNYVQDASIDAPRIPREEEVFVNSETAFYEVLNEFQPDLIIVWGANLEGKLPQKNKTLSDFEIFNEPGHRFHYYDVVGKKIPAYAIFHPSTSRFSYHFHDFLKEALRLAGFDI